MKRPDCDTAGAATDAVALKVTYPKYTRDAYDEIRIHRQVQGKRARAVPEMGSRITELIESFSHEDRICLAFRLHGRDVRHAVRRRVLSLEEVKNITRAVVEGLADLHRAGLIHTDIKPANILYDAASRSAKLADLGLATRRLRLGGDAGTCDYTPPEAMLGTPMSAPVDMWGLGCTVFELLTGRLLFDPWSACERKYAEFQDDENEEDQEEEAKPAVSAMEMSDPDESPLRTGDILGKKYRLKTRLGDGKFAEVWSAVPLHQGPAPRLQAPPPKRKPPAQSRKPKRRRHRPRWDLHDISIAYEHLLQIRRAVGPIPAPMAAGKWARLFCTHDGSPKFGERVRPRPLVERLAAHLPAAEAAAAAEFLHSLLQWDPSCRPTAEEALASPWLAPLKCH